MTASTLTPLSDILFWSRQLSEHALFFSLGLEVEPYKSQAAGLHQNWEATRTQLAMASDLPIAQAIVSPMVSRLARWQRGVMADLQTRWIGWIPPLFWDHTLRELDYFVSRVWFGRLSSGVVLSENLRFMREHAEFAAHLLDPSQGDLISGAETIATEFRGIEDNCCAQLTPTLLALSMKAGQDLDLYFTTNPIASPSRGTIHPVLADHVVREGRRFLETIPTLG